MVTTSAPAIPLCSRPRHRTRIMLHGRYEELPYPLHEPDARFRPFTLIVLMHGDSHNALESPA